MNESLVARSSLAIAKQFGSKSMNDFELMII